MIDRGTNDRNRLLKPILTGYLVMAFNDMVAPISGTISAEYGAQWSSLISFLPSMTFVWYLLLAVPVASLMCRLGRKPIVMASYVLTIIGLMTPFMAGDGCHLAWYFVGFGLLGWGNLGLQVSLNPMLAMLSSPDRITRNITLGQVFRNTALMLFAPFMLLASNTLGDWRWLLALCAAVTLVGAVWIGKVYRPINEQQLHRVSLGQCFALLKRRGVRIGVAGMALFVMSDVACGFLSSRLIADELSLLTTTGYYACRFVGALFAIWALQRWSDKRFLRWNLLVAMAAVGCLMFCRTEWLYYLLFAILGFAFATPFATFYSVAMKGSGSHEDEVAGLLVMAISAGALSGPICNAMIGIAGSANVAGSFVGCCLVGMWILTKRSEHTPKQQK